MIIYKYQLTENQPLEFLWPQGSKILCLGEQNGKITMWVQHRIGPDLSDNKVVRTFEIHGTGENFDGTGKRYIATFFSGPFVWHLYEKIDPPPSILR